MNKYSIYPYRIKQNDRLEFIVIDINGIVVAGASKTKREALDIALWLKEENH